MEIIKETFSVCPTCMKEIPAVVVVNNAGVVIFKTCPEHGPVEGLIEKDPVFYMFTELLGSKDVYPGTFIDTTSKCNNKCKYCFYPVDNARPDRTIEDILKECRSINRPPFHLIGGEPTMRDDLPELLAAIHTIGPVILTTNAIRLADDVYLGMLLDVLSRNDRSAIGISLHPEENNLSGEYAAKIQAIDNLVRRGIKFVLNFTIDRLYQIDEVIALHHKYRECTAQSRIRLVGNVGVTNNAPTQILVSEAYDYMAAKAKREGKNLSFNLSRGNKSTFFNTCFDGHDIIICKFYDKYNVDLKDVNCAAVAMCPDGRVVSADYAILRAFL